MNEWKEYKFNDVAKLTNGRAYLQPELQSSGKYKIVRVGNLSGGDKWFYSDMELPDNKYCNKGDLLYAWACSFGPYIWEGDKTIYHYHIWKVDVDNDVVDKLFLYYYLKYYTPKWMGLTNGSVMMHITKGSLEKQIVIFPPLPDQRRIASILSSLDDKIAINRRICENLEAQAQALFKHWFIDFAPFKNGKFVESELGMIPEGWRVGTLSEIININTTYSLKKGVLAPYLDMKNMPTQGSYPIKVEEKEYQGGMKFKNGDALMARITPCLENGKVAYVNFLKDDEIGFGSTEYIVLSTKDASYSELSYFLCRETNFVNYATKNMNGSSGRQRVSGETIGNYKIAIPTRDVLDGLMPIFRNAMREFAVLGAENSRLSSLRDTLLPKLMSGEIKV